MSPTIGCLLYLILRSLFYKIGPKGRTVLDLSLMHGKWDLAEKLVAIGAKLSGSDIDQKKNSHQKWLLLLSAVAKHKLSLVKILLESGIVDVDETDNHKVLQAGNEPRSYLVRLTL